MHLVVQVSRFFCTYAGCPRKTFAEPIADLAVRSARQTTRLKEVLEHLGLALGGEPASRLTTLLGMTCSPDTLLRLLRRLPDAPIEPPRVVRVDDWTWRRGSRYGTIICDLERHRRCKWKMNFAALRRNTCRFLLSIAGKMAMLMINSEEILAVI